MYWCHSAGNCLNWLSNLLVVLGTSDSIKIQSNENSAQSPIPPYLRKSLNTIASSSCKRFISCSMVPCDAPSERRSLMILACSFISFSISFERFLASREGSNTNAGKLSVKFLYRRKLMLSCTETRINNVAQVCSFILKSCLPAVQVCSCQKCTAVDSQEPL